MTILLCQLIAGLYAQNLEVTGKAKILEMDTVIDATANVVRLSDGTLALRQYKIGDLAHGGIIFWIDETGEHGLVSSLNDLESQTGIFDHQWSNVSSEWTGATGEHIGAGMMNTMLMLSAKREDLDSAARLTADLVEGGYGDWYLPSREELNLMHENLSEANLGNFAVSNYWSSSEFSDLSAHVHFFPNDIQVVEGKTNHYRVRAIRAF